MSLKDTQELERYIGYIADALYHIRGGRKRARAILVLLDQDPDELERLHVEEDKEITRAIKHQHARGISGAKGKKKT